MKKTMLMIVVICMICGFFCYKASALGDPCDGISNNTPCYYKWGLGLWDVAGYMTDSTSPAECNRRFAVCKGNCYTCIRNYCDFSPFTGHLPDFCRNAKNEPPPPFTGQ